jgi:hypothetical protein
MALQGLDMAQAPAATKAKAMLDRINGSWWNVYIGGPSSLGSGWTPDRVREYIAHGITRFLLTYAGRQSGESHLLTTTQGRHDGDDACRIVERFGYGPGTPICLDLESRTFEKAPRASLDYVCAWCRALRRHGLRPGVYSTPTPLIELAKRNDRPDWVWAAHWVTNKPNRNADPHRISQFPDRLWPRTGQRAWQYAGETASGPAKVAGKEVDISVADSGCLAGANEGFTIVDAMTKKYFEQKFAEMDKQVIDLYRLTDHGTTKKATTRTHHQAIRKDLDGLHKQMDQVTKDLTELQKSLTAITTQLTQLIQDSHPQPKPRRRVTT